MKNIFGNKEYAFISIVFILFMLVAGIQSAFALPTITLSTGTETLTISDNNMSGTDTNDVQGVVRFNGNLGVFDILVTIGATKPSLGSNTEPELDLFSLLVNSTAPGSLTVKFSEIGFGPYTGSLITEVGGSTTGSSASFNTYVDASDALFGEGTHVSSINSIEGIASGYVFFNDPFKPFSITSVATLTHDNAGDFSSFNMFVSVPELETTHFLVICLFGLAGIQWRTRKV